MEMPPPGWYEDPVDGGGPLRWWDGTQWTEHTAPTGSTAQAAIERTPGITERAARAVEGAAQIVPALAGPAPAAPVLSAPVAPSASYVPSDPPGPSAPSGPLAPLAPSGPSVPFTPSVPANGGDPSLTDWFQSIPFPVAGRDHPATFSTTRVLDRGGPGTLAEFGWPHSTPVSEDDTPLLERGEAAGRLRRNRTRLMWGLALGAAVAMLITGVLVAVFGSSTAPHTVSAAAAGHPSAVRTLTPKASAPPPSTPSTVPTTGTPVTDPASGLSYATLSTPWQPSCPAASPPHLAI